MFTAKASPTGDVNGDSQVDIIDALRIAQYSAGIQLTGFNVDVADANCDNAVNIVDALYIARYSALIRPPPGCSQTIAPTSTPTVTASPTPTLTASPTCTPCVVVVEGYVRDGVTSQAIAGVPITLLNVDSRGSFMAGTTLAGHYRLAAQSCNYTTSGRLEVNNLAGYQYDPLNTNVYCGSANSIAVNLPPLPTPSPTPTPTVTMTASGTPAPTRSPTPSPTCTPCVISIQGYIIDDLTALPIASASVVTNNIQLRGTTDANGYYRSATMPLCGSGLTLNFIISAPGYETLSLTRGASCTSRSNFCLTRVAVPAP